MHKFSHRSLAELSGAREKLQRICNIGIQRFNFCVIKSYRGEIEQNEAFDRGASMLRFPNSAHNCKPSNAVDVAPWDDNTKSIPWKDTGKFIALWNALNEIAIEEGIKLKKMIPWDSGHIELHRSEYEQ
jgi:hypothetical protein